jgi:hypothetical protein
LGDYKGAYDIQLLDIQGRVISSTTGQKSDEELKITLNLEGIASGIYNCVIQTSQGKIVERIIK